LGVVLASHTVHQLVLASLQAAGQNMQRQEER
jgi:hypothetical protein